MVWRSCFLGWPKGKQRFVFPLSVTCCPRRQGHSCLWPWSLHMWHPREVSGSSWHTANFLSALYQATLPPTAVRLSLSSCL